MRLTFKNRQNCSLKTTFFCSWLFLAKIVFCNCSLLFSSKDCRFCPSLLTTSLCLLCRVSRVARPRQNRQKNVLPAPITGSVQARFQANWFRFENMGDDIYNITSLMYGVQCQVVSDPSVWLLVIWSAPGCLVGHLGWPPGHHLVSQTTKELYVELYMWHLSCFSLYFTLFWLQLDIRILFWHFLQYRWLCILPLTFHSCAFSFSRRGSRRRERL